MAPATLRQPFGRRNRLPLRLQVVLGIGGLLSLIGACALIAVLLVRNVRSHQETLHDRSIPHRERATALALGPGRAIQRRYEASLADAQVLAVQAVDSGRASVEHKTSRSVTILIASLVVAIVIGLVLAVWVVRILVQAIYATLRFLDSIRPPASER